MHHISSINDCTATSKAIKLGNVGNEIRMLLAHNSLFLINDL